MKDEQIIKVSKDDLSLVEDNILNGSQLGFIMKRTPKKYIKQRPKPGGGTLNYVAGGYMKKVLNLMFGWNWDFEILWEQVFDKEVVVKGKLICRANGIEVVKTQYGRKPIVRSKKDKTPISIGNDFKAAATDALKKCASELGIASDIYSPEEFREIDIEDKQQEPEIKSKVEAKKIIDECETEEKLLNSLEKLGAFSFDEDVIKKYNDKLKSLR